MARFHKGNDGWGRDSYRIPQYAVAGCSCTGPDGPAPETTAREETQRVRDMLRGAGVSSRLKATASGNIFMVKVWIVVAGKDFAKADKLAREWLRENENDTRLIHNAD